jgi:hypothetical protein
MMPAAVSEPLRNVASILSSGPGSDMASSSRRSPSSQQRQKSACAARVENATASTYPELKYGEWAFTRHTAIESFQTANQGAATGFLQRRNAAAVGKELRRRIDNRQLHCGIQ